jgi:hypothetical protein
MPADVTSPVTGLLANRFRRSLSDMGFQVVLEPCPDTLLVGALANIFDLAEAAVHPSASRFFRMTLENSREDARQVMRTHSNQNF